MTKMKFIASVLWIVASVCVQNSIASLCKPLSTFKIDCNRCICGSSGYEYTCTEKNCPPIDYREKYNLVKNGRGYLVLQPKTREEDDDNSDVDSNSALINRKTRGNQHPYRYVSDEIPSSLEDIKNYVADNNIDDEAEVSVEKNYVDADLEEARQGNIEGDKFDDWKLLRDVIN